MSIIQNLEAARKQALKDKDSATRSTLTTLVGEITSKAKIEGREATDKDAVKALTKFINGVKENIGYANGNQAAIAEMQAEIALYEKFLPEAKPQLSDEDLHKAVRTVIAVVMADTGAKPKMGSIIADIKAVYEGQYDPKALSVLVKAELDATADPTQKA